jgi:phosphoenolpyruvate-protein kinase (PTS system EI component)
MLKKETIFDPKVVDNMDKLIPLGGFLKKKTPLPVPIIDPTAIVEEIFEWLREKEKHKTLRKAIDAQRESLKKALEEYSKNFDRVLDKRTAQRQQALEKIFQAIDTALEKEDPQMLAVALNALVELDKNPIISEEDYKALLGEVMEKLTGISQEYTSGSSLKKLPKKIVW